MFVSNTRAKWKSGARNGAAVSRELRMAPIILADGGGSQVKMKPRVEGDEYAYA
jgi:hypothetical protein